jgi:methyl-accepting chemotaxis protein
MTDEKNKEEEPEIKDEAEQEPIGHTATVHFAKKGTTTFPVPGNSPECAACSSTIISDFAKSFDKSARRWELIVYPSLFAFIILAMYGFFLIYSLTQDIRTMASSIDPQMGLNMGNLSVSISHLSDNVALMSTHLEYISDNMETMSVDMQSMAENMEHMTDSIGGMDKNVNIMATSVESMSGNVFTMNKSMDDISVKLDSLHPISVNVGSMTKAMNAMTNAVTSMSYDLNGAIRPMSQINRFMPW